MTYSSFSIVSEAKIGEKEKKKKTTDVGFRTLTYLLPLFPRKMVGAYLPCVRVVVGFATGDWMFHQVIRDAMMTLRA